MYINPKEVLAFGNGLNDLEMIRWAGRGVAIEGGEPEALAITCEIAHLLSGMVLRFIFLSC